MSADLYILCPNCKAEMYSAYNEELVKTLQLYGKIPAEEYLSRVESNKDHGKILLYRNFDTLGIYYGIGFTDDEAAQSGCPLAFTITVSGRCDVCTLEFKKLSMTKEIVMPDWPSGRLGKKKGKTKP